MKLNVGERLEGTGPEHQPGGYVVTSVVRETPWYGLYLAKKIFYNFDFSSKRIRETDDVEWLDVFMRTIRYPVLDDPVYLHQRRALARAEARAILGNRHSNLWPEPLDLLEVENERDLFAFADPTERKREPIIVFARPHGASTADWQQQILPIASILSVLAELLEFLEQAHSEGLLLLGLGPASLLIDASNRVHYIGTEMVLSQQSLLLKDASPAEVWQRLFPPDRFARGYAAPECFNPAKRPDVRSDLYSWASLAFGFITATDLTAVAHVQGKPWVSFGPEHWQQFEKVLAQLPTNSVRGWAEQMGIAPETFLEAWPNKLLAVFRMLLSPDPARRPRSVAQLHSWLANPPPSPFAAFFALHTGADTATLLFDCTGVDPALEMTVQCERNLAPQQPDDGVTVAQGPLRRSAGIHSLPVTVEPIWYTAFTRQKQNGHFVHSPGVSALLWDVNVASLRQWVETESATALGGEPVPAHVTLVLESLDTDMVLESLRASLLPRARAWGLSRVEHALRTHGYSPSVEGLLWQFLRDPSAEIRHLAAVLLWTVHPGKTDELLLSLVEMLDSPPLDSSIPIAQFLPRLQLPEERIQWVTRQLEERRPTACPVCQKPLTFRDRGPHLQSEHGFLVYQGDLLSPAAVRARLWQRALHQRDQAAHEELIDIYVGEGKGLPEEAARIYVCALERFVFGDSEPDEKTREIPLAIPFSSVLVYQGTLRESKLFIPIALELLSSLQERLRDLGCQTVVPYLQEQLLARPSVVELRRLLGVLCPRFDQTDLQIDLCRQLSQVGADQDLLSTCIAQLHDERLVACTECKAQVQAKNFEIHLRRAHQIFQFRGNRGTYHDVRAAMVKAVCNDPPDVATWKNLEALAEERHPGEADRYLLGWLYSHFKDLEAEQRGAAIKALATQMVAADVAERLIPDLVGPAKNATFELLGQCIALESCARMPAPVPAAFVPLLTPILDQKEISRQSRENAALSLLRSVPKNSALATDVLRAYVAHSGKKRGLEKLQQLEQRFGHTPALDTICQEVEDEIRMSCPRCTVELRKKEMVGHLWEKHRLFLDGQRVREPWRVIEDWVVDYGLEKDPHILQRCRELALKEDPLMGLARLQRLLYRRGLRDRELVNELRTHVRTRKATLCPHCCTLVPIPDPPPVKRLAVESMQLEGFEYRMEVFERGLLVPSVRIESPTAIVYRGREPGRYFTRLGGIVLLTGPFVALMYSIIGSYTRHEFPAGLVWGVALGLGLLVAGLLYLVWPNPVPAEERLVNLAWKLLVPEMLEEKMTRREWSFLQALAELSGDIQAPLDRDLVMECCKQASQASLSEPVARACLSAMCRRYLSQLRTKRAEPIEFVLTLADACFQGKLPLAFLSDLLENFDGRERANWPKSTLHRLPILLADTAFSQGVAIDDWLNLGRAFPVMNAVLNLEQRGHWLQFRALWNQRQEQPWNKVGDALDMLEMALEPEGYEELFAYYPDVLLYVEKANLVIGTKGGWIEGVCIPAFPPGTDVSWQRVAGGYELHVGYLRIRTAENPRSYLDDIREWLSYYFHEFVPTVQHVTNPMSESRHAMWHLSRVTCPECGRALVPCLGDLGVTVR